MSRLPIPYCQPFLDRSRIKPYPFVPKPKPKPLVNRLPERKRMTIGIGLLCTDGIVIGTDTREVWANVTKRNTDKLYIRGFDGESTYVVASAGSGDLITMFNVDMDAEVWKQHDEQLEGSRDFIDISDIATQTMRNSFNQHILPLASFPQNERPEQSVILGIQHFSTGWSKGKGEIRHGQTALYRLTPPSTCIQIDPASDSPHCAVGIGIFLADSLLDQFHPNITNVEVTADLAVYLLRHVKDVVQDCDGYSDIAIQRNDGTVEMLDRDYVLRLEAWFKRADESLQVELLRKITRTGHALKLPPKPKQVRVSAWKKP